MENAVKLVYTRWATLTDGNPGAILRLVKEDGTLGEDLVFSRKVVDTWMIGGVYEVEQAGENSFKLAARRYVGTFPDSVQVAQWQLDNKAERVRADAAKMEKNDKALPEALAVMRPLRDLYKKSLPDRKRALEVLILDYLRR